MKIRIFKRPTHTDLIIYVTITLVALITRLPLIEKYQSHWDGPQYSVAIIRYSLANQTPAPSGYPLYIAVGKFFHLFTSDLHTSIVLVSVLASVIGALAFYTYGKEVYNKYVGIAATTIFLTGSTFYYLSLTPYGYLLIGSLVVLLALVIYKIFILKKQYGVLYGLLVGICFGVRPQEMLLVGPLVLLGFFFLNKKGKIQAILIFFVVTLLWLIPLIINSGGLHNYIELNLSYARTQGFTHTFLYNYPLAIKGFLLSFGISVFFLVYYPCKFIINKYKLTKNDRKVLFFYFIWIAPGVFYNLFIRGEHAGYQISYLCATLIIIAYAIWAVTRHKLAWFYLSIFLVAVFNLYWFFYNRDPNYIKPYRPTSFHYSDIRKNDLIIGSKVNYVEKNYDPQKTLLLSTDVMWRPYNYYLKNYPIIALFALDNKGIPYIYNKIVGKGWDNQRTLEKNFSIKIPNNITIVILMDTQMNYWIKNGDFKVINLPGNSRITQVTVDENTHIIYDYHSLKFVK